MLGVSTTRHSLYAVQLVHVAVQSMDDILRRETKERTTGKAKTERDRARSTCRLLNEPPIPIISTKSAVQHEHNSKKRPKLRRFSMLCFNSMKEVPDNSSTGL